MARAGARAEPAPHQVSRCPTSISSRIDDASTPTSSSTPAPIKSGFGCSAHQWGGGGRAGRAHVDIAPDGGVVMKVGTQDLGTGTRTMVAMLTAETLGLPLGAVRPEIGDTEYPACG